MAVPEQDVLNFFLYIRCTELLTSNRLTLFSTITELQWKKEFI
jgi:hypothetical protein